MEWHPIPQGLLSQEIVDCMPVWERERERERESDRLGRRRPSPVLLARARSGAVVATGTVRFLLQRKGSTCNATMTSSS